MSAVKIELNSFRWTKKSGKENIHDDIGEWEEQQVQPKK